MLLECFAVAVLLELLPRVEDVPGDLEPVEPEHLLRALAEVGMEGEVAAKVRPAGLPPFRLKAVVGAEAIRTDDAGELVTDKPVEMLLAAIRRDLQHRRLLAEGAPERARLAIQVPAGLVDVERARRARPLEQLIVDRLERLGGASEDRVDRPDRDRTAEQLLHQLDELPPREPVPHRERRDRRLQLRTEAAARDARRQLHPHCTPAVRTAEPLQAVLVDLDRQRWQLRQLVPRRSRSRSSSPNTSPHAQRSGQWSTTSVSRSLENNARPWPGWPGCPPCLRPVSRDRPRFPSQGGSWLGGNDELRESRFSCCSSSSTRSASAVSCASCASSRADNASNTSTTGSRPCA